VAADQIQIIVTSGADRLSQREQIQQVLQRAQQRNEPLRIRIPFTLYDHAATRSYVFPRDATWNLQIPQQQLTVEMVQDLIATLGKCITAVAQHGSAAVFTAVQSIGDTEETRS